VLLLLLCGAHIFLTIIFCPSLFIFFSVYRISISVKTSQPSTTYSRNHRMVGVGRDLCGSSSPTPLPKQGHLHRTLSRSFHILFGIINLQENGKFAPTTVEGGKTKIPVLHLTYWQIFPGQPMSWVVVHSAQLSLEVYIYIYYIFYYIFRVYSL